MEYDKLTETQQRLLEMMRINPDNLSGEWLEQPQRHLYFELLAAEASALASRAKVALSQHEAELDKQFRAQAAADGRKMTEATVQAEIRLDPEYARLEDECHNANLQLRILQGMIEASRQKLTSLKYLANLLAPIPSRETALRDFAGATENELLRGEMA